MAELGAGVAIAAAVSKLGQFLHQQASFLFNIRDKIERLKKELSWMQSFLQDAEKKLDNSSLIREWVSDVRDLAYDCEDVIDTFLLKLRGPETQPGCIGTMSRCFVAYNAKIPSTYNLGCQIEKLMTKVTDISSRRERYGLDATDVSTTSDSNKWEKKLMQIRRSTPYANNEHMVGLSETISLLEGKLTEGGSGRFVISILGMGGLGKTTLARKLYNSLIQGYFELYSWVCVSQEYNTRDILLHLIKSMAKPQPTKEDLESITTEASMEAYLREKLTGRRFLVVIDDVWEREVWESLERAFPDDIPSSYINPSLRTLFCQPFSSDSHPKLRWNNIAYEKMFQSLFECFSLLRVLDIQVRVLEKVQVIKIPWEIGRLIHLRYLALVLPVRTTGEFPETISNLKALETLSVRSVEPVTLPKTIVKLKNLRHLIGRFASTGDWIGKLTSLKTLDEVSYDQWCDIDTTCLVNLRHVFVTSVPQDDKTNPTKFYDKFKSLTMLQTLALGRLRTDSDQLGCISASEIFKRCPSITHFSRGSNEY